MSDISEEIEKTCENCKYELEEAEGTHCRHCIHNAEEHFELKPIYNTTNPVRNNIIDEFASTLIPRLTDAIYQKNVASMTNLINDVARELKAGGIDG